jgi:hypothetical protein
MQVVTSLLALVESMAPRAKDSGLTLGEDGAS